MPAPRTHFTQKSYFSYDFFNSTCEGDKIPFGETQWWISAAMSVLCVLIASIAAGLTMGLVSIDEFQLMVLMESRPEECDAPKDAAMLRSNKARALRIMPLVSRHHLLLVTLLLTNALANELLPLALDDIAPAWLAVILSVSFVLLFGEILPSAIFTGPNQLKVSSWFTPLVWGMLYFLCVLAYPLAKCLDCVLGHGDGVCLGHSELRAVLRMHGPKTSTDHDDIVRNGTLSGREVQVLLGVMDAAGGSVRARCSVDVVAVAAEDIVTPQLCLRLAATRRSRVVVTSHGSRHNVVGVVSVADVMSAALLSREQVEVRSLIEKGARPFFVSADDNILDVMFMKSRLGIVVNSAEAARHQYECGVVGAVEVIGVVTVNDVVKVFLAAEDPVASDATARVLRRQKEASGEQVYGVNDMPHTRLLKKIQLAREKSFERNHLELDDELDEALYRSHNNSLRMEEGVEMGINY